MEQNGTDFISDLTLGGAPRATIHRNLLCPVLEAQKVKCLRVQVKHKNYKTKRNFCLWLRQFKLWLAKYIFILSNHRRKAKFFFKNHYMLQLIVSINLGRKPCGKPFHFECSNDFALFGLLWNDHQLQYCLSNPKEE